MKDKGKGGPPAEKAFNNPFAKLKALKQAEAPVAKKELAKKEPPPAPKATAHDDDVALFLSRVGGTQRLREDKRGQIAPAPKESKKVTLIEMHDLVSMVDRGSQWLHDETLDVWHAPGVPFALVRQLANGKLEPEARLDLHGLRVAIAEPTVEKFLRTAQQERRRCVLIITGRGEQSGAVLHDAIADWLKSARLAKRVLAFVAAPRSLGGDGATLVLVRRA